MRDCGGDLIEDLGEEPIEDLEPNLDSEVAVDLDADREPDLEPIGSPREASDSSSRSDRGSPCSSSSNLSLRRTLLVGRATGPARGALTRGPTTGGTGRFSTERTGERLLEESARLLAESERLPGSSSPIDSAIGSTGLLI
jgi:hypothetical protein